MKNVFNTIFFFVFSENALICFYCSHARHFFSVFTALYVTKQKELNYFFGFIVFGLQ